MSDRPPIVRLRRETHEIVEKFAEQERLSYLDAVRTLIERGAGAKSLGQRVAMVNQDEAERRRKLASQEKVVNQPASPRLDLSTIKRVDDDEEVASQAVNKTPPPSVSSAPRPANVLANGYFVLPDKDDQPEEEEPEQEDAAGGFTTAPPPPRWLANEPSGEPRLVGGSDALPGIDPPKR